MNVAYQNKDIFSKIMAEEFCGKSFAAYGIDVPEIIRAEPTNLPEIEASELRMDNLFELADGSYAIVDYEISCREANKINYLGYLARILKRLYNQKKKFPKIRMIVIYTQTSNPKGQNQCWNRAGSGNDGDRTLTKRGRGALSGNTGIKNSKRHEATPCVRYDLTLQREFFHDETSQTNRH